MAQIHRWPDQIRSEIAHNIYKNFPTFAVNIFERILPQINYLICEETYSPYTIINFWNISIVNELLEFLNLESDVTLIKSIIHSYRDKRILYRDLSIEDLISEVAKEPDFKDIDLGWIPIVMEGGMMKSTGGLISDFLKENFYCESSDVQVLIMGYEESFARKIFYTTLDSGKVHCPAKHVVYVIGLYFAYRVFMYKMHYPEDLTEKFTITNSEGRLLKPEEMTNLFNLIKEEYFQNIETIKEN